MCRNSLVLALLAVGATAGCKARDLDAVGEPGTPIVLLLSPSHAATPEARHALGRLLTAESGLAVEVRAAEDPTTALAEAGGDKSDFWLLPLFDYLFAHQEYQARAVLQVVRSGDVRTYRGELLVRSDADVKAPAQLAGRKVAFVAPHSVSGFLLPAKTLRDLGADVTPVFAGTHEAAVAALRAGTVDAAAVHAGMAGSDGALRVLATTDEVPNEPVFARRGLPADKRARFAEALARIAATEPGRALLARMADVTGLVPVSDQAYATVHEIIRQADHRVEDLVPRGWTLRNLNRLTPADFAP